MKRFCGPLITRGWFVCCLLIVTGCATVRPPATAPALIDPSLDWATVLSAHVDGQGRVDFHKLADEPAALHRYVGWLATHGPKTAPRDFPTPNQILAYHLNAYNALAMFKVLQAKIPTTLAGWRKLRFFVMERVLVDGEARSLYAYENEIIRPLGDPRVHVALNCMVVSCPRLPSVPFDPLTLEVQLEAAAREFFSDPKHVRIDSTAPAVKVSAILDFYPDDFLNVAPNLTAYINRYRATPIPEHYRIDFIDYDWTINQQP